jgi:hypothetical protein
VTEEKRATPVYTGVTMYTEPNGFSIWVPSDWHKFDLTKEHKGIIYSPYPDDFNTGILVEKRKLKYEVKQSDLPVLREAFMEGIKALPGAEIESEDEHLTHGLSFFEVRFTFLEGEKRRKRWIRNVYWAKNQYILIAQGRTPEDFDHWLPMFYNIMTTAIV